VIDLRLVAGNDADRQVNKLIAYVQSKGYTVLDHEPTDTERKQFPLIAKITKRKGGYNAQRTPMDLPIAFFLPPSNFKYFFHLQRGKCD
jgi:hypothetical protein